MFRSYKTKYKIMNRPKLLVLSTAMATAAIFTFTACHKMAGKDDFQTEETAVGNENATVEKTYDDVQSIADEAGTSGNLANMRVTGASILGGCASVSLDTTVTPHTLTIDFGTTNCLCQDGNYRRGQILVSFSGRYRDSASSHTITFNNYFKNDNQVTGSKTVTNMGHNASGQPYFDISVNGSIILANNAGTISASHTRTRTWTAGYNTPQWNDDVFEVTGSGSITRANNKTFNMNITSPLVMALNCKWIEQGTIQVVNTSNNKTRTLDYGNGTCDALATYTVNGTVYNISLH